MLKRLSWRARMAVGLVALSAAVYVFHWVVFRDAHHIFIYLVGDVAFVPLEVLMVTLVLHELLQRHERKTMLSKMNMVVGAFFSEGGTDLLGRFAALDPAVGEVSEKLVVDGRWSDEQFRSVARAVRARRPALQPSRQDLEALKGMLVDRRAFVLGLLQNPNLLEHDSFTDMLWAVCHLTDELAHRPSLADIPDSDLTHLTGDARRAYGLLVREWVDYLRHLKRDYPYLFSLAVRTNPFDPQATPIVAAA